VGSKTCIPKDSPIFDALGSLDELNSLLGVCRSQAVKSRRSVFIVEEIKNIQEDLFIIQAEFAGAEKKIRQQHIEKTEALIQKIEDQIVTPTTFTISGSTALSALLDYARAVSRRVERTVLAVQKKQTLSKETYVYLNRLSSALYALARFSALDADTKELSPSY